LARNACTGERGEEIGDDIDADEGDGLAEVGDTMTIDCAFLPLSPYPLPGGWEGEIPPLPIIGIEDLMGMARCSLAIISIFACKAL